VAAALPFVLASRGRDMGRRFVVSTIVSFAGLGLASACVILSSMVELDSSAYMNTDVEAHAHAILVALIHG
jgi:hypothetical protein